MGLARNNFRLLQSRAGNTAVSRLVAQRLAEAPAPPVKPPPSSSPAFTSLKSEVKAKKTATSQHRPAGAESKSAQDAALAPPDDKQAQGKAAQAEKMNAAKPGVFDKAGFIAAVNQAITAQAPKNLSEADKFAGSGKAEAVKSQVNGQVAQGKETSAKDIDTTTKAAPDLSAAKDKQVTPLTPDAPPPTPGAPNPAGAVPAKQPDAVTDFSGGPDQVNQQMTDAEVTEDQLAKSNEPEFTGALTAKKQGEQHSATAPGEARGAEAKQLAAAKQGAATAGTQAMTGLAATRAATGKQVDGGKSATKSADEKKRAEVTSKLQKVFDATKTDVEKTLTGLDKLVDEKFTAGEKTARDAFTADHKRRMDAYKDKRYSGFTGKLKWVKDKFAGMPEEANQLFQESRKLYVAQMQQVISSIADTIGTELGKAKDRIAKGRTELKAEVDKLPADLKKFGQEAAADFTEKFDGLEADVNAKSDQLVQDLAQKYTQALNAVDEEIKKLQDENKGLIAKAKDAVVGVIKTILELKNMLLGILAKAASAVMKIIKDPIGFLRNLVSAVGAGFQQFIGNIGEHLKKGLMSWLLGTAVKAGINLPAKFDLKGIIQLLASMLGLTWDNIRARITRKGVPEPAMAAAEQSIPVAQSLQKEGPAGAVEHIKNSVGDLKSTILQKLTSYLIPTVLIAGITWIVSLLNPASAFIRAVKGIIDIVTFIVTQGAQIAAFVNSVLDAVIAIANGGQAGVPALIEGALAASIPVLIGFLAALLGVGGLANKVKQVFHAVARPVNKAIDKIVDFIAKKGKALWAKLKGKQRPPQKPGEKGKGSSADAGTKQPDKRAAIRDAEALLASRPTRQHAGSKLPALSHNHGVPLRLVVESTDTQGEKVHVQAMVTPSHILPVRPIEIKLLKTPTLDRLEQQQPGTSQRYVDDFKQYEGKQTIVKYVEGRAARKLGRVKEKPGIEAYNRISGMGVEKNNQTIEILNLKGEAERERIPDFFNKGRVVGDIKNVAEQSYDEQMRDNSRIAKGTRVRLRGSETLLPAANRFDLLVRAPSDEYPKGTHVSGPLKEAIADNGGTIYEIL
ncbi:putative toxin [Streptomyces sp. NPDC052236]|uniref:putative toxin n=1 Tax=Streptomyces sp. NPDC052236 TaxID=3365686 RepID=UPI0037D54C43